MCELRVFLIDADRQECQDGSVRYDLKFQDGGTLIDVSAYDCEYGVEVTYGGVPPVGDLRLVIDERAHRIAVLSQMFDWYFPCLEHQVQVGEACTDFDNVSTMEAAQRMALDDTADERAQNGVPKGTGRGNVYKMVEMAVMPESEWVHDEVPVGDIWEDEA